MKKFPTPKAEKITKGKIYDQVSFQNTQFKK